MADPSHHEPGCFPCVWRNRRREANHQVSTSQSGETQRINHSPKGNTGSKEKTNPEAKAPETTRSVPQKAEYALEATKKTLEILKGVAALVPIPLVKEVIELGLSIIKACEAVNDVHARVAALKNRIAAFLLVIAKAAKGVETSEMSAVKFSDVLEQDLRDLKACLLAIAERLDALNAQNKILTGILAKPSLEVIDDCATEFQDGVERFQALRSLYAAQDLATIQQQLIKLYGITQEMADDVKITRQEVHEMRHSLNELKSMLAQKRNTESTILARIPRSPGVFFGRNEVVQRVVNGLISGDPKRSRVCILGPGGMGKTCTALAVMEHPMIKAKFEDEYRFWVPCISANSPTIFLSQLSRQLRARNEAEDVLEGIIASLTENEHPRIILLDNFETPWNPDDGSCASTKLILEALDDIPHLSILVTMRSGFAPLDHWDNSCEHLVQLQFEDSRRIFISHYPGVDMSPDIDELLAEVGHLPYAITLLATRGKRSGVKPKQLLQEWRQRGTSMLSKPEDGMDHSIGLSLRSKLVADSPGAIHLLKVLSMLPAGIYTDDLDLWIDGWDSGAVETLRDCALVISRDVHLGNDMKTHIFVLPVLQSYMGQAQRIPPDIRRGVYSACCRFLLLNHVGLHGPNDPQFKKNSKAISTQETNILALLTRIISEGMQHWDRLPVESSDADGPLHSSQLDALLSFVYYQRWYKPRPEMAEQAVQLARKAKDREHEALALFGLASNLEAIGSFAQAQRSFAAAREVYEELKDEYMIFRCLLMELDCWMSHEDSEVPYLQMRELQTTWAERMRANSVLHGYYVGTLGQMEYFRCRRVEGIQALEEAQPLFRALKKPFESASCLYFIARCQAAMGNYEAAVKAIDVSVMEFSSMFGEDLINQDSVWPHFMRARFLKGLGEWGSKLEEDLKISLESFQDLGLIRPVGQCLDEWAEVYVRRGEWEAARLAYEEVLQKTKDLVDHSSLDLIERAENNLKYIKQSMGQPGVGEPVLFQLPPTS